jgi:chorismate dehydratase
VGFVSRKIRVSFIEFLNAIPLGWGFMHGSHQGLVELLFDVPSECARHLMSGEADVGLIPVVEYFRIPGLKVIPEIAIAARGKVKSVLFVSKVPIEEVKKVALDSSSRTSTALLKILLSRFYGRESVEYSELLPNAEEMLVAHDAALLIGNAALQIPPQKRYVYDLALEWNRFTGLPFVFAFWAVREGVELGNSLNAFYRSREEGIAAIDEIASMYADRLGLAPSEIRSYLSFNLDYSLDDRNMEGLQLFFSLAHEAKLLNETASPLTFA